jgi:hypothetical protein
VGYFDSSERAHEALNVVRRHYPAAWVATEPTGDVGSLDDTLNTSFRILREARARVVTAQDFAPQVLPTAATAVGFNADSRPQRYVVQLDWSITPIRVDSARRLAVFRDYHLYSVRSTREGAPQHGLRLGFFKNIHSAAQVAVQSRTHYPRVSVLPISHRDYTLAADLILKGAARLHLSLSAVDLEG